VWAEIPLCCDNDYESGQQGASLHPGRGQTATILGFETSVQDDREALHREWRSSAPILGRDGGWVAVAIQEAAMTLRRLVVLALVLAPVCAHADPKAELDAAAAATAAASAAQAVSAALAREDAVLQRAIDRKLGARLAATLAPPLPVRGRGEAVAARGAATADSFRRPLYAVSNPETLR
jgi:hypothetical protein